MYYYLNWELVPPLIDLLDSTQGNEIIEISIQDIDGQRPACLYTIPIVQAGQSFSLVRTNLLYPMDDQYKTPKSIIVRIRIVRGYERRIIYLSDFTLSPEYFVNGNTCQLPLYRLWYVEDYVKLIFSKVIPGI